MPFPVLGIEANGQNESFSFKRREYPVSWGMTTLGYVNTEVLRVYFDSPYTQTFVLYLKMTDTDPASHGQPMILYPAAAEKCKIEAYSIPMEGPWTYALTCWADPIYRYLDIRLMPTGGKEIIIEGGIKGQSGVIKLQKEFDWASFMPLIINR